MVFPDSNQYLNVLHRPLTSTPSTQLQAQVRPPLYPHNLKVALAVLVGVPAEAEVATSANLYNKP